MLDKLTLKGKSRALMLADHACAEHALCVLTSTLASRAVERRPDVDESQVVYGRDVVSRVSIGSVLNTRRLVLHLTRPLMSSDDVKQHVRQVSVMLSQ